MHPEGAETGPDSDTRLPFETLLVDLSSRFINLAPDQVDHEIEDALRRVCELLGIEFAVLWQWSTAAADVIVPTHSYDVHRSSRPTDPLSQRHYPWVVQQMRAGRLVCFSRLEDLPAEAAVDRESARHTGIRSNLTLPLAIGGEPPVGAVALNTLAQEHEWPDTLVARLQLFAQIFTYALARRRTDEALRESDVRLELAADAAEAGLWTFDSGSGVFWATERARELFGYSPDEIISLERLLSSVHPEDRETIREAIERSVVAGDPVNLEYRIILPDGTVRWIASRGRRRSTSTGGADRLMGVSIDVTDRRHGEEARRASERRLAAGAELAGLAYYDVDFDRRSVYVDDRLRDVCGIPADSTGLDVLEFWAAHLHPEDRELVLVERRQMHDGILPRISLEYRYLHPVRGEIWIHHTGGIASRDATGRAIRTFGVLRDVTEIKRAERELRDLSRRLIAAHEDERALLARELHDDVTQRLAVMAIDVGRAELESRSGPAPAETMKAVREGLVSLSEDIHTLAYQLHPSVLDELGLAEALRAECERRRVRSGIAIAADLEPTSPDLGKYAALCLFRVAQEALTNVVRHAVARQVRVVLRRMDGGLLLSVRDDGVGFDPKHPKTVSSLGLISMRERVRLANGTLDIESAPGRGTAVVAWVPGEGEPS